MKYDSLVAPESLSVLAPPDFVPGILRSLRALTSRINALTELDLANLPTRTGYTTWDVLLSDITPQDTDSGLRFLVPSQNPNIDAVGVGFATSIGLRGKDFFYDEDTSTYLFKKHPSNYGTISIVGSKEYLTMVCYGSPLQSTLEPLGVAYRHCTDSAVRGAVYDSLCGNMPMGFTGNLLNAIGGCRLSGDPIETSWVEGDYNVGITSRGELVYIPTILGVALTPGSAINIANSFVLNNIPDSEAYCVRLTSGTRIILAAANNVSDYPKITEEYPTLSITGGKFYGNELIALMLQRGCVFYRWNYIKNNDAQRALSNYAVNPGKVVVEAVTQNDVADDLSVTVGAFDWGAVPNLTNFTSSATAVNCI